MHERPFTFITPPMRATATAALTDLSLLSRAMRGNEDALDTLVDRYVVSGVALAIRLAGPDADAERVLDAVHDAFITAFDQAAEGDEDNVANVFQRMVSELAAALRASAAASTNASSRISSEDMRQLRHDLITELRLTISLRGNPASWLKSRRILQELRIMRRRVRLTLKLGAAERVRMVVRQVAAFNMVAHHTFIEAMHGDRHHHRSRRRNCRAQPPPAARDV
jgi:hypothetical protein